MTALYNDSDPFAAQWLRNLLAGGHIAEGAVDQRSIADLRAGDLAGVTQFHAFAGIAGWSRALRLAGIADDAPVWTGSCPCQPFSAAGRRKGFDDARHLWPEWFRLIRECRPAIIFGEQTAGPDGLRWLDLVFADLEGEGYACGAADLCAAGIGAPHIRQRLYFVAYREGIGRAGRTDDENGGRRERASGRDGETRAVADGDERAGGQGRAVGGGRGSGGDEVAGAGPRRNGGVGVLADSERGAAERFGYEMASEAGSIGGEVREQRLRADARNGGATHAVALPGREQARRGPGSLDASGVGPWSTVEWIACLDGKARPTQPGLRPMAHGIPGRVGRLRAYGNAIVPQVAAAFIRAVMG